ncbi:MAG: PEP-CTERM sorting domain-containing protein [Candidatus Auribacterota bacterium]
MKRLGILTLAGLILACAVNGSAITVKDEAAFLGVSTGKTNYVDYIYTNDGPILTTSGATFNFVHGDAAAYDTDSTWYYYYQVENLFDVDIVAFSLNVNPHTVMSAGWITGVDLDDSLTFNHNGVAGDHETAWVVNAGDPSSAVFNPSGIAPNVSYDFDSPTNDLYMNEQSTVLFLSCVEPPVFKFSSMQNGESFNGLLPVPQIPQNQIPEPMTLILISSGIASLIVRKRS